MTTTTLPAQPPFLKRKIFPGIAISTILLAGIMVLTLALHLANIQSIGDANAYYTAAVQSMLKSWSNFFFVAAEPGGSVTVDKPPLGLWIEAAFAWILWVSGFSVSLPNILAGVLGIPVLYHLVRKHVGELAGLTAALVMALTPVFVATNRNNTMDGMLVFFLLLAAWAFIRATETGRARWLMLGAFIVGLGFNIKMMQAFLPLPAFYALYFLGSKEGWVRKAVNLGIASVLLIGVSLSWAVVVDLIPADSRPYIGSSGDNTVMGLILGHNGSSRLFGGFFGPRNGNGDGQPPVQGNPSLPAAPLNPPGMAPQSGQPQAGNPGGPPQEALAACSNRAQGETCSFVMPFGTVTGTCITPPNLAQLACAPAGMVPQTGGIPAGGSGPGGGTPFSQETGSPGALRFFTQPLSKQMSWLLPFALISMILAGFGARLRVPLLSGIHTALILWGGWLLTCVVFFSVISGIFHAYYAIMLVPPLGAVVGLGFSLLWNWGSKGIWAGVLLLIASAITIAFQWFASNQYGEWSWWMLVSGVLLAAGGLAIGIMKRPAYLMILCAMLIIPAYWTVMTTVSNPNINLPTAYQGTAPVAGPGGLDRARQQDGPRGQNVDREMVDYLQDNTQDVEYLVAVPSAQQGAPLVLATGRPVLYMGGFGGQDHVVSAEDLSEMVMNGELRYVLYGGDRGGKQDIANWLNTSCSIIPQFSNQNVRGPQPPLVDDGQNQSQGQPDRRDQQTILYMCG